MPRVKTEKAKKRAQQKSNFLKSLSPEALLAHKQNKKYEKEKKIESKKVKEVDNSNSTNLYKYA